jgi:ubiquinone/menaquinone biosynthesis C-methylase UbiE
MATASATEQLIVSRYPILATYSDLPRPRAYQRWQAALFDRMAKSIEQQVIGSSRARLLASARGRVLDTAAGTGANLSHYPKGRDLDLVLLEPHSGMLARAARKARALDRAIELRRGRAEVLPFANGSFDTVVFTYALCTVPDPARALQEAGRVLRPDGRLLLLEHVRAQDPRLARRQDQLAPVQRLLSCGCNPNRDTRTTVEAACFAFDLIEEWVEPRFSNSIVRPHLLGVARKGT